MENVSVVNANKKKGLRTKEIYDTIDKPNYKILFSPNFWLEASKTKEI